jgi:hypothetical protein
LVVERKDELEEGGIKEEEEGLKQSGSGGHARRLTNVD